MGIEDGWLSIELNGDMADLAEYLDKYDGTLRGINIKTLSQTLRKSKKTNDEFRVTFTLFALSSLLCPTEGVHMSSHIFFSAIDVNFIRSRNWATFCVG